MKSMKEIFYESLVDAIKYNRKGDIENQIAKRSYAGGIWSTVIYYESGNSSLLAEMSRAIVLCDDIIAGNLDTDEEESACLSLMHMNA